MGVDSDGFVAQQPYVTFTDASLTALEYADALAPGDSVTGVIPFSLFGDTTIEGILYSPSYDRLVTVLDLRTAPVAAGTPVTILNTSGAEAAQVTVNSVTAPFEGYDASSAPPRGSTYVAVDVTVTNTGSSVLSVSPSDFWVIDADGFVLSSTYVTRTDTTVPDYDYIDLNPGDSQHGMLVYQIYEGVPVAQDRLWRRLHLDPGRGRCRCIVHHHRRPRRPPTPCRRRCHGGRGRADARHRHDRRQQRRL